MSIHCPTVRMCGLNYLEAPIWGILPGFLSEDSILCYLTLAVFINGVLPYDALWGFPCLVLISQTQEKNARTLHPLWLILPPFPTCKTVRHRSGKGRWALCGRERWKAKPAWLIRAGGTPCPPCSRLALLLHAQQ